MRRASLLLLVLCVASAFLAASHFYLAQRLVLDPDLAQPWRGLALGALAGLGATLVLQPIAERRLGPALARLIAWPASLWMGFAFLLLLGLLASDALLWLAGGVAVAAQGLPGPGAGAGVRAAAVTLLALLAGLAGLRSGLAPPQLRRVEIELPRWPASRDGYRIVQISDIHIGPILGRALRSSLVERVNALAPDLVAVTGDLVDGKLERLADEVAPFAGLRGRDGVFFVTGNHDHYSGAEPGRARSRARHARAAQRARRDRRGRAGLRSGRRRRPSRRLIGAGRRGPRPRAGGRDPARPAILLAHDPSTFKRALDARHRPADLGAHARRTDLAVRLLVRLVIPTVAGRYAKGGAQLYVSRGTGFWGPPMRLCAPAEITEIVLRAARAAEADEE